MIQVFYHENCTDGMMAAWLWREKYGDANHIYTPYNLREAAINHEADKYVCLDCVVPNLPPEKVLIIIDHHVGNLEKLSMYPQNVIKYYPHSCGAMLTWEHLYGNQLPLTTELRNLIPWQIPYIDDRDRWQWKLPDSRAISAGISAFEFTFDDWTRMMQHSRAEIRGMGQCILDSNRRMMKSIISKAHYLLLPTGEKLLAVNSPVLQSELGNILATYSYNGMGAVYNITPDKIIVSLRSIGPIDVNALAKKHGGGGHLNASSCSLGINDLKLIKLDKPFIVNWG